MNPDKRPHDGQAMEKWRRCNALASGLRREVYALNDAAGVAAEGLADMLVKEMDDLFGILNQQQEEGRQ